MLAYDTEPGIIALVKNSLTFDYLQKLERQKFRALTLILVLVLVALIGLVYAMRKKLGQTTSLEAFTSTLYVVSSLLGASWSLRMAYMGSREGPILLTRRHCTAWL